MAACLVPLATMRSIRASSSAIASAIDVAAPIVTMPRFLHLPKNVRRRNAENKAEGRRPGFQQRLDLILETRMHAFRILRLRNAELAEVRREELRHPVEASAIELARTLVVIRDPQIHGERMGKITRIVNEITALTRVGQKLKHSGQARPARHRSRRIATNINP